MTNNYQELKNQAETLRKQNRYVEALKIYEKLWQERGDEPDKWIGWGYGQCLRKEKQPEKALEICQDVYRLDNTFEINNSLYGWCVYDVGIKQAEEQFDESRFLKAAEAIVKLTTQSEFSPYEKAVFAVVHHFEKYKSQQKAVPHNKIIGWLEKLNPDLLSFEPNFGSEGKSYPSPKEDWYSSWAKALIGLERYAECIEVCSQALAEFKKFHYDYDVWFRQYRAESHMALNEVQKALSDIEYMMERKPDAWIRHRYGLALYQLGHLDEAIQYICEAAIPHQRLGFRWEVYLDLGNMLFESDENDLAIKHILLAAAIRKEEGWEKTPENLQNVLDHYNLSIENLPKVRNLHSELKDFWKSMKPRPITSHKGIIDQIHNNGKSGNIRADDGCKYFFGMRHYKSDEKATVGLRVGFNLQETENNRTGAKEIHAVDIIGD